MNEQQFETIISLFKQQLQQTSASEQPTQALSTALNTLSKQFEALAKKVDDIHRVMFTPVEKLSVEDQDAKFQFEILSRKPKQLKGKKQNK